MDGATGVTRCGQRASVDPGAQTKGTAVVGAGGGGGGCVVVGGGGGGGSGSLMTRLKGGEGIG